jgi:hypothetical protein
MCHKLEPRDEVDDEVNDDDKVSNDDERNKWLPARQSKAEVDAVPTDGRSGRPEGIPVLSIQKALRNCIYEDTVVLKPTAGKHNIGPPMTQHMYSVSAL